MSTAPPKESSTFSQAEIDALFSGGSSTPPPAPPAAAPSIASTPAGAKSPPQPEAQASLPPQQDGPNGKETRPPETKPVVVASFEPKAAESQPLEPGAAAVATAPSTHPTKARSGLIILPNRSELALLLASFLTGIIITLVGIYCWHHPFFVPQTVLTAVKHFRAQRPPPPPPQQRVFVGTPLQIAAQFNSVEGFSIATLDCTGYQSQGAELLPVITLVASETHSTDRLICANDASVAEMSVNRLLQDGYQVHGSLVSLPAFRLGATPPAPSQIWYLFALHKEPGQTTEAKMTLFETEAKTARVLERWLQQGWHITHVVGRPLSLQTNYVASSTTMAAVFLERPKATEP